MSTQLRIRRLFSLAFGSLAMLAVALLSAFVTMRLAIHGREVDVPSFVGLSIPDAQKRARSKGLSLNIENRFEREPDDFYARIHAAYLAIAVRESQRVLAITDDASIDLIELQIRAAAEARLPKL